MKKAYFAGGCFWCITPVFRELNGVCGVTSGFAGGKEKNPSYEDVKNQRTKHRETIEVEYDESKIDYETLVDVFLGNVDPFDDGGQFIDRGRSYTLAVYYGNEYEKIVANDKINALERGSGMHTYVSLEKMKTFYPAEEYHQDYDLKNPEAFQEELKASGRK